MTRDEALAQPGATESAWGRLLVTCPGGHESVRIPVVEGRIAGQYIDAAKRDPHCHVCRRCADGPKSESNGYHGFHMMKDCSFRYEANVKAKDGSKLYP